jgi:hypothetical protein
VHDANNTVDGRWHHVAITFNAITHKWRLYVDGAQSNAADANVEADGSLLYTPNAAITGFTVGSRALNSGGYAQLPGDYREVTLHRVPLTATAIKRLYEGDIPKLSLEGHWPLDDQEPLNSGFFQAQSWFRNLAGTKAELKILNNSATWAPAQAANVTRMGSAATLDLSTAAEFVYIGGVTNISAIASTRFPRNTRITLGFDGALTVTDGNNLVLAGDFVTTGNDTLTLQFTGTYWLEIARSIN